MTLIIAYRGIFPGLDLLDSLAHLLELLGGLLDGNVHALPQSWVVPSGAEQADVRLELGDVALQMEELVHETLRQARELRVIRVGAVVAATAATSAAGLYRGELVERHFFGFGWSERRIILMVMKKGKRGDE